MIAQSASGHLVRRLRNVPGAALAALGHHPRPGERLTSFAARDAHGIPLDLRLTHLLDWRDGFFVEAGANDGLFQSNTAMFEQAFGWNGILIEPSPTAVADAAKNRRAHVHGCALVAFDYAGDTVFGDFDGYPMGSIGGDRLGRHIKVEVPARTLQSILDEHQISHVDFLSLDAEGYELEILNGVDFGRVNFSYMLIELYPSNHDAVVSRLEDVGYELLCNYTGYNPVDTPQWDGSHNDYLFRSRGLPAGER